METSPAKAYAQIDAGEEERNAADNHDERTEELHNAMENAHAAYNAALEAIPRAEIKIQPETKLTRQNISNMPEIRYTGITSRFNADRITAFVVIDTETTGLRAASDRIVELSAILYEDFQPLKAWSTLINPGKHIDERSTDIHHITDEMVADAPTLAGVAEDFKAFVGSCPIMGYNLPFDLKFLWASGIDLADGKRRYYDMLETARARYKDCSDYKLGTLCNYLGIWRTDAHRSLSDCYATACCFLKLIGKF